ncbi:hypothetical protein [Blastococcus tunisiensis]|uniref:Copper binding protein, plastocyanin/azurin family n=1 Tax=Blastococcus tunisiensis TaxID=1798228 RepID=A0A1I2HHF8_9ACTN|nr:hypothetical protein [Blastococcus sp. DSM 46838]SFF29122.1 hypothetical protein SAMN05216574_11125 [Blastococcus sp. DSM 46838]
MRSTTGTRGVRRLVLGGASLALAATMVACGSDDPDTETRAAGADASGTEASGTEADPAEFCSAAVAVEAAFGMGPDVEFETATPAEIEAALAEFAGRVDPLLERVEETAPEEIAGDVGTAAALAREASSTGDIGALDGPEFQEADAAMDEYMLAECGYEQLEATGVDYEFEGIPDSIEAGTVAVTFHNEGEELHEIGLARIDDDVTMPVEELLVLPEEQAMSMVTFTGAAFAEPGSSDTTFLQLEPGRYAAVCFVPEGTTHHQEGEGPPHFTLGMVAEFTVG